MPRISAGEKRFMDKIEPVTIIAPLRLDFVRGIETVVKENTMRAGHTFADL